jgi:nitrate reductase NapE component
LYILLGDFIALSVSKIGGYQFQIWIFFVV